MPAAKVAAGRRTLGAASLSQTEAKVFSPLADSLLAAQSSERRAASREKPKPKSSRHSRLASRHSK